MTKILIDKETVELALEMYSWAIECLDFDADDSPEAYDRLKKAKHAITALRQALEQPTEQEPAPCLFTKDINGNFHPYKEKGHTENCAALGDDCSENHLPPSRFGVGETKSSTQPQEAAPKFAGWMDVEGNGIPVPVYTFAPVATHNTGEKE